jgi:hypothetical protein
MNTVGAEMIRIALLALVAGVALPLLVQLFVTLRAVTRVVKILDERLEPALRDVGEVAARLRQSTAPSQNTSAVLAALAPALIAAVRTFRGGVASAAPPDQPLAKESTS